MKQFNFRPNNTQFSLINALSLAEASALAYKGEREIKNKTREWGFNATEYFEKNETQAFVASNDNMILLAFRGTEMNKLKDILTDLDARMTKFLFGKVHLGFNRAVNEVWEDLRKYLKVVRNKTQPLYVTGHSLGGALANLAVAKIIDEGLIRTNAIYTYGQPRVGDKAFVEKFNRVFKPRTFRFQNNEDAVTLVPWVSGYKHVSNLKYFDSMGRLHTNPKLLLRRLDVAMSNIVRAVDKTGVMKKLLPNALEDHGLDKYIRNIEKNMKDIL